VIIAGKSFTAWKNPLRKFDCLFTIE